MVSREIWMLIDVLPSVEVQEWTRFVLIPLGDLLELWQARTLVWSAAPQWSCGLEALETHPGFRL